MAASAASKAAADAQRQEIAQRRKDADQMGILVSRYLDQRPGADGQMISTSTPLDMAIAGKINGQVAGETTKFIHANERQLEQAASTETKQKFNNAIQVAETIFEQSGLNPRKVQEVEQSWAGFREELTSKVFRDNMDPFEASDKILNRYISQATGVLNKRQQVILGSLPQAYRTTPELGIEPALAKAQEDFLNGIIQEGDYRTYARRLRELEEYPEFMAAQTKRKTPAPAPAPAPAQPGIGTRLWNMLPSLNEPPPRLP